MVGTTPQPCTAHTGRPCSNASHAICAHTVSWQFVVLCHTCRAVSTPVNGQQWHGAAGGRIEPAGNTASTTPALCISFGGWQVCCMPGQQMLGICQHMSGPHPWNFQALLGKHAARRWASAGWAVYGVGHKLHPTWASFRTGCCHTEWVGLNHGICPP